MANQSNRSALFTSRDTENSIVFFTITAFSLIVVVLLHAKFLKKQEWWDAFYMMLGSISKVLASATMLTIFKEGVDIMLTRYREYRKREKKRIERAVEKAREEAREKGRKEGYDAGYKDAKSGVDYHVKGAQGTRH